MQNAIESTRGPVNYTARRMSHQSTDNHDSFVDVQKEAKVQAQEYANVKNAPAEAKRAHARSQTHTHTMNELIRVVYANPIQSCEANSR